MLNAVPKGRTAASAFISPNGDDKKAMKGNINPQGVVQNLVPTLKIGDRVKIDFVYLGPRRWISNVTKLGNNNASAYGGTDAGKEFSFKVSSMKSLRIRNVPTKGLVVYKGRMSWTFVIPNVPNVGGKPGTPDTVPDPAILKKAEQFSGGDEVIIDYETSDFMFVIKDIRPVVLTETGRVINVGERKVVSRRLGIDSAMCPQAVVLGKQGTRALLVRPAEAKESGASASSEDLTGIIKGLEKDQTIEFKYYVQGGLRWLIDAQVTNQTASSR